MNRIQINMLIRTARTYLFMYRELGNEYYKVHALECLKQAKNALKQYDEVTCTIIEFKRVA